MAAVTILHHDLEWSETAIAGELIRRGHQVQMRDIRQVDPEKLRRSDLVLNRVYPSVAGRDFPVIQATLDVIAALERMSLRVVNPLQCCLADYSKFVACQMMRAAGVPTPETELIDGATKEETAEFIRNFAERVGMPVVVKRNTSGRAVDVMLAADAHAILRAAELVSASRESRDYSGRWVVQEFIRSPTSSAFRVLFISGVVTYVSRRSLVKYTVDDPFRWISSFALGSHIERCEPTPELVNVVSAASKAICADVNALDIASSEGGMTVIENNPTPNFVPEYFVEVDDFIDGVERLLRTL